MTARRTASLGVAILLVGTWWTACTRTGATSGGGGEGAGDAAPSDASLQDVAVDTADAHTADAADANDGDGYAPWNPTDAGDAGWRMDTPVLTDLELSGATACGLTPEGEVICWGFVSFEEHIPAGPFVDLALRTFQGCGIRPGGEVECWGEPLTPPSTPMPEDLRARMLIGGVTEVCAVTLDDDVVCWGTFPDDTLRFPVSPGERVEEACIFIDEAAVIDSSGRLRVVDIYDGDVFTWPGGPYHDLACGDFYTCALDSEDRPKCYHNLFREQMLAPAVAGVAIGAEQNIACASTASETGCWDPAGLSTHLSDWYRPPPGPFSTIRGIFFHCGLRPTGHVECWAAESDGDFFDPPSVEDGG